MAERSNVRRVEKASLPVGLKSLAAILRVGITVGTWDSDSHEAGSTPAPSAILLYRIVMLA